MQGMEYLDTTRVVWRYDMPMGEMIVDFYDKLKSATKGYATMNYDFHEYRADDLVKLDIYVHGDVVESLSMIVHRDKAYRTGKEVVESLKELIPRHLFPIPLQAGIGGKMIARETIPAIRKDVIAKCYG
jgi:GTP-binding protein LepA